jgi:hypothetical protein
MDQALFRVPFSDLEGDEGLADLRDLPEHAPVGHHLIAHGQLRDQLLVLLGLLLLRPHQQEVEDDDEDHHHQKRRELAAAARGRRALRPSRGNQ